MKSDIIFYLIILSLITLYSCSNKKTIIDKSKFTNIKEISRESLFILEDEIELELNKKSIISFPFNLCVVNNNFIISSQNNTIKVFNKEGKFVREIGNIGKGPGEYKYITSVFQFGNGSFGIYDSGNSRLTFYDIDGNIIKSREINIKGLHNFNSILYGNNLLYLHKPFTEQNPYHVLVMDTSLNIIGNLIPASPLYKAFTFNYMFNGNIALDSYKKRLYELNSFHSNYIIEVNLKKNISEKIFLKRKKQFKMIVPTSKNVNYANLQKRYHSGTGIYRFYLIEDNYFLVLFIDYDDDGRGYIKSYLYDIKGEIAYSIKNTITPNYCDGNYLYEVVFISDKNERYKITKTIIKKYKIRIL